MILSNFKNFEDISKTFLNKFLLCTPTKKYKIEEIEIYYSSLTHPDPFVHCDKDQSIPGMLYFHRMKGKGFKEGTFKGVDFTFCLKQDRKAKTFGGVLLRSMRDISSSDNLVEGSCRCVNKILADNNCSKVKEFADHFPDFRIKVFDTDTNYPLYFVRNNNENNKIYTAPRVGLTLRNDKKQNKLKYIMKRYRFFTNLEIKKFKCGIICSLYQDGLSIDDIQNICKTRMTKKYINFYVNPYKKKDISKLGKLKVESLCKLYGYVSSI